MNVRQFSLGSARWADVDRDQEPVERIWRNDIVDLRHPWPSPSNARHVSAITALRGNGSGLACFGTMALSLIGPSGSRPRSLALTQSREQREDRAVRSP
jgi:hypothetical protein